MEFPLGELPPELQAKILSNRPELARSLSETSRDARRWTVQAYLNDLCSQPIGLQEKIDLFSGEPEEFPPFIALYTDQGLNRSGDRALQSAIYSLDILPDPSTNTLIPTYRLIRAFHVNFSSIETDDTYLENLQRSGIKTAGLIEVDIISSSRPLIGRFNTVDLTLIRLFALLKDCDLDLINERRIISRRKGCLVRDPDYPVKRILVKLDVELIQSQRVPSVVLLFSTFLHFYTEGYLHNMAKVMVNRDLEYTIEGQSISGLPEDDVRKFIEEMYVKLRKMLEI